MHILTSTIRHKTNFPISYTHTFWLDFVIWLKVFFCAGNVFHSFALFVYCQFNSTTNASIFVERDWMGQTKFNQFHLCSFYSPHWFVFSSIQTYFLLLLVYLVCRFNSILLTFTILFIVYTTIVFFLSKIPFPFLLFNLFFYQLIWIKICSIENKIPFYFNWYPLIDHWSIVDEWGDTITPL